MILIRPSFCIEAINGADLLLMEKAGRTCYKSEAKGDPAGFLKSKIKAKHLTIIEHGSMTVRFIADRGFTHELVRHRMAVYSQECLAGDVEIRKGLTIKELYERQENGPCYDHTHNKTLSLRSMNNNGEIIPNKFTKVFYKGIQKIYEITTRFGYKIKCTKNHRFMNKDFEFTELKNFKIGDHIMVNGRPSLCILSDQELIRLYNEIKWSVQDIAEYCNVPCGTIRRRLKFLNIFSPRKNDSNKEKYNKNHTQESYQKMSRTIQQQYLDGRIVWNKGITEDEHESVKRQADSLRLHHHNNGMGKENSHWNGGPTKHSKAQLLKSDHIQCELCGEAENLQVHHIDGDCCNNEMINLIKICSKCHHLLHHGWHLGTKGVLDEIIRIDYMGEENTYDLEMKYPFHNYIANGFVVHNSTRYCDYSGGVTFVMPPWIKNIEPGLRTTFTMEDGAENIWHDAMLDVEMDYKALLKAGWSPQQARTVLPNSLKTEIVMTANFREWRLVFEQRALGLTGKPHPQMLELMVPLLAEVKTKIPAIFDDLIIESKGE